MFVQKAEVVSTVDQGYTVHNTTHKDITNYGMRTPRVGMVLLVPYVPLLTFMFAGLDRGSGNCASMWLAMTASRQLRTQKSRWCGARSVPGGGCSDT